MTSERRPAKHWNKYAILKKSFTENLELCRKPRRSPHSDSSFAKRSPRSALELRRRKDRLVLLRRAPLRPPVTRKTKEQQSSPSSPTKLPTSSEIVPRKKNTHTHTTLFTHSFIHHRLVLIGLRLLSAWFLLLHLPLLPCALLAQKRAEERRIYIINHFVHTTTQNKTSLSLSYSLQSLDPTSCPLHWNSPTLETQRTSSILRQQRARRRSKRDRCRRRLRRQENELLQRSLHFTLGGF